MRASGRELDDAALEQGLDLGQARQGVAHEGREVVEVEVGAEAREGRERLVLAADRDGVAVVGIQARVSIKGGKGAGREAKDR